MNEKNYFSNDSFVKRTINKYHGLIQEQVAENIKKHNIKIKFNEATWVLKQEGGGFSGDYQTRATLIDPIEFGVLSISKDKSHQCSKIHVWSDGCNDGQNCFLINVPNGLFKIIQDPEVDKPIT